MKNQNVAVVLSELSPARVFARPTAENLWLGPTQTSALSQLSRPVAVRALLGPQSSGRTSLLRHLTARSDPAVHTLTLPGPERLRKSVVSRLLKSAGLTSPDKTREALREQLANFFHERRAQHQRVVILVDDADTFGPAAFDELLQVRNELSGDPATVQLLLVLEHIDESSSPAADFIRNENAPCLAVLSWMNVTEVCWYLNWRLKRFGVSGLITDAAARQIAQSTQGCFAAVDYLCQMALLLLRHRSTERVDESLVREAVRALTRPQGQSLPHAAAESIEVIASLDGKVVKRVVCGNDRLMIGRSRVNDIHLDDQYLSRHHVAIVRGANGFYASDLNSVNGVVLNGRRIKTAPLGNGDVICIGPYSLKIALRGKALLPDADVDADAEVSGLSETWEMPVPEIPEPARLKLIK